MLVAHLTVVPAIERDLAAGGNIPLTWYDVLLPLRHAPDGRLRMRELAEQVVLLSRTRVSRIVQQLVDHGLVRREADPIDGRATFAVITPEGRARLRRAAPVYVAGIERHFARHLTAQERKVIARGLGKVAR